MKKTKINWWLLPLSPIAIAIGFVVGLCSFFKRKNETPPDTVIVLPEDEEEPWWH